MKGKEAKDLLIADLNDKGQRTGEYTSLAEYQRMQKELPHDAAPILNVSANIYSQDYVKPERAASHYEDRSRRSQTVNSL
jgi:hypothetical protein